MKKPTILVIQRSKWLTPDKMRISETSDYISMLLDTKNNDLMCCLGFYCVEAGCSKDKIADIGTPGMLRMLIPGLTTHPDDMLPGLYISTNFTSSAMTINDNEDISNTEREQQLIELFRQEGITLSFID